MAIFFLLVFINNFHKSGALWNVLSIANVFFSWIAAIGLVENSSVLLVASMLVSPLMVFSKFVPCNSCLLPFFKNRIGNNSSQHGRNFLINSVPGFYYCLYTTFDIHSFCNIYQLCLFTFWAFRKSVVFCFYKTETVVKCFRNRNCKVAFLAVKVTKLNSDHVTKFPPGVLFSFHSFSNYIFYTLRSILPSIFYWEISSTSTNFYVYVECCVAKPVSLCC